MENEKTLMEVFEEIAANELDFLPPDPGARAGFMGMIQFLLLIT